MDEKIPNAIKFPKTLSLNDVFINFETESKAFTQNAKFIATGKLIVDSFNIQSSQVLKKFTICTSSKLIKNINMLINDQIIEIAEPEYDTEKVSFNFSIFDQNGVVQIPKVFDINFICEPRPTADINVQLQYYGITYNKDVGEFFNYNQYYSVHKLNLKDQSDKVLVIYYAVLQNPSYNVRFLNVQDIEEFSKVVEMSYFWKPPTVFEFVDSAKKEKHRLITVECDEKTLANLENDEQLKFESRKCEISKTIISKNFIVHKDEQTDVEGYLLSEYGLIPYTTIVNTPVAKVNYTRISEICNSQIVVLKKVIN